MIATHETLWLDAPGTIADTLSPGRVQRALSASLRLSSDALGLMHPLGRGRVAVEIALPQALRLATPLPLALSDADKGRPHLYVLRRPSDPSDAEYSEVRITWRGDKPPGPGQLTRALQEASGDRFDTGDLGAVYLGHDWLLATLSEGLRARLSLPTTVNVAGIDLTLSEVA